MAKPLKAKVVSKKASKKVNKSPKKGSNIYLLHLKNTSKIL